MLFNGAHSDLPISVVLFPTSVTDPVPDLATQAHLLQQSKPVRLLWAIVDTNGDIAFYSLQDVELPIDITTGW